MDYLPATLFIGLGATAVMDFWGLVRQRLFGIAPPNYALVGRWVGHMPRGRFHHPAIATAAPVRGERALGWAVHYLTGVAFAALLVSLNGVAWLAQPSLGPALALGIATVAAPFLLMQPGMGAGIAASRTARPATARLQSLITHAVFGAGLFAAAKVAQLIALS